ncbi:MAG TPA: glycosyltransferase [Alphaproteobacteria bacterium]|nr:glycosyltransferase [Alphaproteobacteria bacterium]
MKILYISSLDINAKTGAADHIIGICKGLAHLGHIVHCVVGMGSQQIQALLHENLKVHPVPVRGLSRKTVQCRVIYQALQTIKAIQPEIIYLRTFPMDLMLCNTRMMRKTPYVCEINSIIDWEYAAKGQSFKGKVYRFFEGYTLAKSAGWLPMTDEIRRYAERSSQSRRPFLISGNGVDVEHIRSLISRTAVRQIVGVSESVPVLVMVGFSRPWHGLDRVLAMLCELSSSVHLWLIGARDKDEEREVLNMAKQYGVLGSIQVFPWIDEASVAELVAAADVGVGPLGLDKKKMTEAQPLKVRFYLALGTPVLINYIDPRIDTTLPFVSHVPSNDPKELAKGVEQLLALPQAVRGEARIFARERLSWRGIAQETAWFLRSIVGAK